ncbi:hypothetical protein BDM02DRAFT_1471871 [Thelephora ganbajun]|uniref:Uncharacterized protein n=1 Tax=Thelephora ganbajun TaxID=370292 RepID=A0ACB6Z106_THEGA|nr:hypothetical protein BDM02DRAFT_1471871 [Thelephora ganbajun]
MSEISENTSASKNPLAYTYVLRIYFHNFPLVYFLYDTSSRCVSRGMNVRRGVFI